MKFAGGIGSDGGLAIARERNRDYMPEFSQGFQESSIEAVTLDEAVGDIARRHEHLLINLTVNAADTEAIRGMADILSSKKSITLNTIAGAPHVFKKMKSLLESFGMQVLWGRKQRVLAWK